METPPPRGPPENFSLADAPSAPKSGSRLMNFSACHRHLAPPALLCAGVLLACAGVRAATAPVYTLAECLDLAARQNQIGRAHV